MIRGVGCDVTKVARFASVVPAHVLSPAELTLYETFGMPQRKQEFLAGRFAVKEAIIKAAPIVLSVKAMNRIVVLNDVNGRPYLASDPFPGCRTWLSIAHEADYAIGLCVIETEQA